MIPRLRLGLLCMALAMLAGCDWGSTSPVSITVDFQQLVALNEDGSCTIRYSALAAGIGSAQWVRVAILESGTVVREFSGAQVAEFWGARTISAGEQQISEPYRSPNRGANVQIEVVYRVTGPERTITLTPACPTS